MDLKFRIKVKPIVYFQSFTFSLTDMILCRVNKGVPTKLIRMKFVGGPAPLYKIRFVVRLF